MFTREITNVVIDKKRFLVRDQKYSSQYFELYNARLNKLKSRVFSRAQEKWSGRDPVYVQKMTDIEPGKLCCVVGTIYVENALKPRALDEIKDYKWPFNETNNHKLAHTTDNVILEDKTGRVSLLNARRKFKFLITGIVLGVLGMGTSTGDIEVEDICYANEWLNTELLVNEIDQGFNKEHFLKLISQNDSSHKLVAFISGIEVDSEKHCPEFYSFTEFLNGSNNVKPMQDLASRIVRVVIVGNSFKNETGSFKHLKAENVHSIKQSVYKSALENMETVDRLFYNLGKTVCVDIIPGKLDPVPPIFPQQPFNNCILPETSKLDNVSFHTNPTSFSIDNVNLLGTSGCNIDDIYKYSLLEDRIEIAQCTLLCSHIAPTAPDTLWCYSFSGDDKLVFDSLPDIYFIGNQPKYQYSFVKHKHSSTLVLMIPSFSKTGTVVLVDIKTLQPFSMVFSKCTNVLNNKKRKEEFS